MVLSVALIVVVDMVVDGALDLSATFVIRVDHRNANEVNEVKDKGGARVQGAD